jgi:2'-5' RNA ligase
VSRLFVAVALPPDIEADLDEHIDPLRAAVPDLRWAHSSRWHITIEFLGECGPYEVERQRARWAEKAARTAPFEVALRSGGAYPHPWMARVLWAGVEVDLADWQPLAGASQQPHLTVARSKHRRDLTGLVQSLEAYRGEPWLVDEILLVESFLRPSGDRGPRYEPQDRFELTV